MSGRMHRIAKGVRRLMWRKCLFVVALCLPTLPLLGNTAGETPTVGIEGKLDVLLPGTELTAKPAERNSPLTVRIASTRPHGTLIHYDLRYVGLVPGRHDLRTYLLRKDGSPTNDLPPIDVQVAGILPPEHEGQLALNQQSTFDLLGGYRWVMGGVAGLWGLAGVLLICVRRPRKQALATATENAPPTLADRLRPLVESAGKGKLSTDGKAELERLLVSHWCQRLGLESLGVAEALVRLREHPEAGALLRALEDWLHRPPGTVQVNVDAMLLPYAHSESSVAATQSTTVPSRAS